MGYPLRVPLTLLQRHAQVEEATRCLNLRYKEETGQVFMTIRGLLTNQMG